MVVVYRFSKELTSVMVLAAGAILGTNEEHLIHPHVQCVSLECIYQFVEQFEYDGIYLRVLRTPAPAVDAFVAWELTGRLIELRVLNQEWKSDF
jgi:hypothetical protein